MKILYLGPADACSAAREILEPHWAISAPDQTPEAVASELSDTIAILDASMRVRLDNSMLDRAPNLRVISTATTGADHIDAEALAVRRIPLFTLSDQKEVLYGLTPAAELSWMLLLACARQLKGAMEHVLKGWWIREKFPGIMLKGKTLGIIGCGRIGAWMARYAHAFGMQVIGYDPFVDPWPDSIQKGTLEDVLSKGDFISIHVSLTDQTRSMIGAREFRLMKRGAIFINSSRGAVIDEAALLESLQKGHLRAAGLDVLEGEPETDHHPLVDYARQHDNLIITPHIGGFSPDAVKHVVVHAARRIAAVLNSIK